MRDCFRSPPAAVYVLQGENLRGDIKRLLAGAGADYSPGQLRRLYRIYFGRPVRRMSGTRLVQSRQQVGCCRRWPPRVEENIDRMVLPKDDLLTS